MYAYHARLKVFGRGGSDRISFCSIDRRQRGEREREERCMLLSCTLLWATVVACWLMLWCVLSTGFYPTSVTSQPSTCLPEILDLFCVSAEGAGDSLASMNFCRQRSTFLGEKGASSLRLCPVYLLRKSTLRASDLTVALVEARTSFSYNIMGNCLPRSPAARSDLHDTHMKHLIEKTRARGSNNAYLLLRFSPLAPLPVAVEVSSVCPFQNRSRRASCTSDDL
ncbi:unnamed protein product [Ectocarpus sp. 12 AP-2014]